MDVGFMTIEVGVGHLIHIIARNETIGDLRWSQFLISIMMFVGIRFRIGTAIVTIIAVSVKITVGIIIVTIILGIIGVCLNIQ